MNAAPSKKAGFPWDAIMAFGLGRLRLAPEHFWSMTPRELSSAMSAYAIAKGAAPSRAAVEELMSRFPDEAQEFSRWKRK